MGTSFKQHFDELDCLLKYLTPNITERRSRIHKILTSGFCMTRKDDCDTPFIPASQNEWKRFYKCPDRFIRKYRYNASQEYYPTILDVFDNVAQLAPVTLDGALAAPELPYLKLSKTTATPPPSNDVFSQISKKIQKLEIAQLLEHNIIGLVALLGEFRPVCENSPETPGQSHRNLLCGVAGEIASRKKGSDRQRHCWIVIKAFAIERHISDRFACMFRKICGAANLAIINLPDIPKALLTRNSGFIIRNKKNRMSLSDGKNRMSLSDGFFSKYYKKFFLLMCGFILQKQDKSKYKYIRLLTNSASLSNIAKTEDKDILIYYKLVDSVTGKEFSNSKNNIYRLKYLLYNKATVVAEFGDTSLNGLTAITSTPTFAAPNSMVLPGGSATDLTLALIQKLIKQSSTKATDLVSQAEESLKKFSQLITTGLSIKYKNLLDMFDAERKVFINRFPVILPAIQKNLPSIAFVPVTDPQEELQKKFVQEMLLPVQAQLIKAPAQSVRVPARRLLSTIYSTLDTIGPVTLDTIGPVTDVAETVKTPSIADRFASLKRQEAAKNKIHSTLDTIGPVTDVAASVKIPSITDRFASLKRQEAAKNKIHSTLDTIGPVTVVAANLKTPFIASSKRQEAATKKSTGFLGVSYKNTKKIAPERLKI